MTDEELDRARAEEAVRLVGAQHSGPAAPFYIAAQAARLAREGWTPTDPLMVEANRIAASFGVGDDQRCEKLALAALKRGMELAKRESLTYDEDVVRRMREEARAGRKEVDDRDRPCGRQDWYRPASK